nr:MAG TPA: hypothetical protein [Caudoviricetes sp.]
MAAVTFITMVSGLDSPLPVLIQLIHGTHCLM